MAPESITTNGRAIRRYRILAGLTAADLSTKAGISKGYVTKIECGLRGGSPTVLKRLADALNVQIVDIVNDEMAAA